MKKTLSRSLSLLLAVVLAVSLTLPAAATFPITLDQSKATIAPKDSITLTATLSHTKWNCDRYFVQRVCQQEHHLGVQR